MLTWWWWLFTCPQRSCYWSGSLCQDPAGNQTTWRPDHRKNCGGMVTSPVHQVWPQPSCKAQWKGKEDKADRGRVRKTTSGNEQAWSSPSPRGHWRTGKNGGNWLWNHLWCPSDPGSEQIDETARRAWGNISWIIPHLCFVLKVDISSYTPIPLLRPQSVYSCSVSCDNWGTSVQTHPHIHTHTHTHTSVHLLGKEKHPAFSSTAEKSSDLSLLLICKVHSMWVETQEKDNFLLWATAVCLA